MIKTISDPKIDWLIKRVVGDDKLMDLKPILAGGSMLSVYRAYKLYDTQAKWNQLVRAASFNASKNTLFKDKVDAFGDIDAWFFSDSSIHTQGYGSWLLSDLSSSSALESPLDSEYRLVNTSKWANSFRRESGKPSFVFQAIKTPINSVPELFETFDFINCCVAYHDGVLYYDSRLDTSFENFSLDLNNSSNYEGESISKRVYAGLRAFKYSKRYLLDFSPELAEKIFHIFLDIGSIDYSEYKDKVTLVNDVYGTVLLAVNDFKDMVASFELNFKNFTEMKTFKSDYALFLINRRSLDINGYLNGGEPKPADVFSSPCTPF